MYFQNVLEFFMQVWLRIIAFISEIIFFPIYSLLLLTVPNLNNYLEQIESFISEYIIKGTAFVREVLFNVTGYPRPLFNFLINFLILKLTIMLAKFTIQMVVNTYYLLRGSK